MSDALEGLRQDLVKLRIQMKEQHNRYVPVGDLLLDRWETARAYGFGQGSSCYSSALVIGEVIAGEQVWIGPNVVLDGSGGLTIGDHVTVSAGAQIYTHNSVQRTTTRGFADIARASTRIAPGVYIGPNAIVEMGVEIGEGAVIGALTLVRHDVPPGFTCYGVPGVNKPPKH